MAIVEALCTASIPGFRTTSPSKVEHLLKQLPPDASRRCVRRGCAFVTTAVESVDDRVLGILEPRATHAARLYPGVAGLMRGLGLFLVPTLVPAYSRPGPRWRATKNLLANLIRLGLVEHVPPVQLTIRLLIPAGSRLLEVLPLHNAAIGPFEQGRRWSYPWANARLRG